MKMVFDESYGELSFAQRAAYRKHNVSPSDHDELVEVYGENRHAAITAAVKDPRNALNGDTCFSTFLFRQNLRDDY